MLYISGIRCAFKLIFLFFLVLFASSALGQAERDYLQFSLLQGWKVGHHAESKRLKTFITEYVRLDEDIKNWTELITIQCFPMGTKAVSPEYELEQLKAYRESKCPGTGKWNVIKRDKSGILYETRIKTCPAIPSPPGVDWSEEYQIKKIIHGKYNRFHIFYTVKGNSIPDDKRAQWIKIIGEARVITSTKPPWEKESDSSGDNSDQEE